MNDIKDSTKNNSHIKILAIIVLILLIILAGFYAYKSFFKLKVKNPEEARQEAVNNVAKTVSENVLTPDQKEEMFKKAQEQAKNQEPIKITPKEAAAREDEIMKNLFQ